MKLVEVLLRELGMKVGEGRPMRKGTLMLRLEILPSELIQGIQYSVTVKNRDWSICIQHASN